MTLIRLFTVIICFGVIGPSVYAGSSTQPAPLIVLKPAVEDGQKVIHALITADGKPLRDLKIQIHVKRTFGLLLLGEDTTDDEGTAAVKFPQGLPGNENGELQVVATITSPNAYGGVNAMQVIPGGVPVKPSSEPAFPRALWSARSPLPLVVTVVVLIATVWLTYARVVGHILAIRKGGRL